MAAVLLNPLPAWLALALGGAAAAALFDRQLALLAGLALAAFLLGAGRGALAASVALPREIVGQTVAVSGTVDDDPVARKASRRADPRGISNRGDRLRHDAGALRRPGPADR